MIPKPTYIFRIMHIKNLPEILKDGYIYCCNQLNKMGKLYESIAHESIMNRRASTIVPCGPQGNLLDYVAFYFGPRSPMLYSIYNGNVEGCSGNQEDLIYVVSTAQRIEEAGKGFVFSDGHGIVVFTRFFENFSDFDKIDWNLMNAKYWYDTDADPDRKRRRQAEFLIYQKFPWDLVTEIGVLTIQMKEYVKSHLDDSGYNTQVRIKPDWYY